MRRQLNAFYTKNEKQFSKTGQLLLKSIIFILTTRKGKFLNALGVKLFKRLFEMFN